MNTKEKSDSPDTEEVLNVFRESDEETLTVQDLEEELPIKERAIQKRLKKLKNEGRLVIDRAGKPNLWRLADSEPEEPVYHPKIARAKRLSNRASEAGRIVLMLAISFLGAAGFVMSIHVFVRGMNIPVPLIQEVSTAIVAMWAGVFGAVLFGLAFVAKFFAYTLPRIVEWRVENRLIEP